MTYEIEKDWKHAGLRCVVIMTEMGHRCGYVGVSETHILYGKEMSTNCLELQPYFEKIQDKERNMDKVGIIPLFCAALGNKSFLSPDVVFEVHGGITFSRGGDRPVESDLWWFGFDCAHHNDAPDPTIASNEYRIYEYGTVRTLEYCELECNSLAEQLVDAEKEYHFRKQLINKKF